MKKFSLITIIVLAVSLFAMAQMKVLVYLSDGTIYENLVSRLDSITLFTHSVTPDEPNNPGNPDTPVNPDIPDNPPADDDAEQTIVLVAKKIENTNQVEIVAKCSVEPKSIIWEVKEEGGQYSQVANQNGKSLIITPYSETNTYVKAYMVNSKDEKIESAPIIVSSTCSNVVFIDDFGQFQGETERASSDFIGPEYTYVRECQALKAEGTYAVLVNSKYAGNGDGMEYNSCDIIGRLWYRDICDHTQGGYKDGMWGGMLLVNANAELVYSRPVEVVPNTTMVFSAWVTNASKNELGTSACYSRITLVVKDEEGQELTSIDFNISCDDLSWKQGKVSFNTKENSKVSIELYNSLPGALGNDFLIDDISFSICEKQNFDFIEPNLVEFNANDGVGDILSEAVVPNSIYVIPSSTFTREGYEFTGWNTKADGTGTTYAEGTEITISSNLTLYAQWKKIETQPTINANGHEYVDLGLPSGILWATCNVGADSPEKYGDYFAWGETEPKDYYHWETYKLSANGHYGSSTITKYCLSPLYGTVDNKNILELSDDAANANWGGDWRMPTIENFAELKTECTWSLVTKDGIRGFTVKGKNGNTIFLPEGGDYLGQDLFNVGSRGAYWSSNLASHDAYSSCFYIGTSQEVNSSGYDRCRGYSVRPVLPKGIVIEPEKPDTPESSFVAKPFSISATETITFSPGNLQYHAANDEWRFAPSQLDYIGEDNKNISPTYNGWIDLFGFGTGENPTNASRNTGDYSTFVDWGVNKIGNDVPNTWRTLTKDEWEYIIQGRTNAEQLIATAQVNGVNGLIILPDNWICPNDVTFKYGFAEEHCTECYGNYQLFNELDWEKLEASGAVFFPAAGSRDTHSIWSIEDGSFAWTTSVYNNTYAYGLAFHSGEAEVKYHSRFHGLPVRLAKEYIIHTLSFDANGGSGSMPTIEIGENESISIPTNTFNREDYKFTGWNTKADGTGTSYTAGTSVTITSNITLYAQWKKNVVSYTISFNANGGSGSMSSVSKEEDTTYSIPSSSFTRSGYTFTGWNTKADGSGTSYTAGTSVTITSNITLYAQWKKNVVSYTISFNANGGSGSMSSVSKQEDTTYSIPSNTFTRSGYTFTGWNTKADGTGTSYTAGTSVTITSNITLYAQWKKNVVSYTISFNANGGSGSMSSVSKEEDTTYSIPSSSFTRSGYTFTGWNTKADGSGTSYTAGTSVTITSNITLYAQWKKNVVSYTISFNANGGSGSMSSVSKQEDTTYSIPSNTFTRSGYTFTGWNTKADGTGTSYTAGTSVTITSNITFYAQWQEVATQPTINANGHEYVDLGLPSGTLWATLNVGATSPEGYGDYFAWGETTTKSSFTNSNSTYKWYDGYQYTKYIPYSYAYKEIMDDKSVLELCDDAANVNWGGDWRMPLQEEQQELLDECTWTYGAKNGVNGFHVKGPNGNSIFLPAAGKDGGDGTDLYCYIWSSNIHSVSDFRYASFLYLHYEKYYGKTLTTEIYGKYRYHGMSVRPVMRDGIIHSVVFNSNGGVGTMSSFSIEHAQSLIIPDNTFVREGYEFIDWNTKADGTGTSYSVLKKNTITCNLTLYAQWYKKEDKVNHDYVDLGLPSGTLWATKNIGASSPEDYGDYFAWGETTPKSNYGLKTYKYSDGIRESITKYCTDSYDGVVDNKTVLEFSDDAAYVIWGSDWCMPTKEQQDELRIECTWKWTTLNGINGYKVTSRTNGNSIFLPASGYYTESILYSVGEFGKYWSKSLYTGSSSEDAFYLLFRSSSVDYYNNYREGGSSIRPVLIRKEEPEKPVSYTISFNANGGSGSMSSVSKQENTTYSIPSNTFTRSGYTFTGWNTKADGSETSYSAGASITITSNITLYAQWQEVATQPTINANGHEYVDLGLPSGTLWATMNVGATSPEDYGDYFAWGETGTKSTYSWENYKWCNGSNTTITKYCTSSTYGTVDNKTTLDIADDVAHVKWGGDWRMPTKAEQDELRSECTWVWTTLNGINGYKVTSRTNGNSIFLPAAGGRNSSESYDVGVGGYYWSSSLGTSYSIYSRYLYFLSEEVDWYDFYRDSGRSVRPVLK